MYLSPSQDRSRSSTCVTDVGLSTECTTRRGGTGASSVSANSHADKAASVMAPVANCLMRSEDNADSRRGEDGELRDCPPDRRHNAVVEYVQQHVSRVVRVHHAQER